MCSNTGLGPCVSSKHAVLLKGCSSEHELLCVCRPLGSENLLLRGATLKNTKHVYGNVVWTCTNMLTTSYKYSTRSLNATVMIEFALLSCESWEQGWNAAILGCWVLLALKTDRCDERLEHEPLFHTAGKALTAFICASLQRLPSTLAWKPRWRSTTRPSLRNGQQWRSKPAPSLYVLSILSAGNQQQLFSPHTGLDQHLYFYHRSIHPGMTSLSADWEFFPSGVLMHSVDWLHLQCASDSGFGIVFLFTINALSQMFPSYKSPNSNIWASNK